MTDSSSSSTDPRPVTAGVKASGRLRPPASKSQTQRFYNLALLASGRTLVQGPLRSEDCEHFLAGLRSVGCRVEETGDRVTIEGPTGDPGSATVFCGASGTMMRFLTAALAVTPGQWRLDGVERLRQRPQGALLAALRELGATIDSELAGDTLPLAITGRPLSGGRVSIAARDSSQYVSALLMAGAATESGLALAVGDSVSRPYIQLTLDALRRFGVVVESLDPAGDTEASYRVPPARPRGAHVVVEPDVSAACYPAAAAALTAGDVVIEGVTRDTAQGDVAFFDLLEGMGAQIDWNEEGVRVSGTGSLRAVDVDMADMPDQVPTLAAIAPFAVGTTRIRNVAHLRLKESDRLAAMEEELRRMGAEATATGDGLVVGGSWVGGPPQGSVTVSTHDDHRIAMSCALSGLRRGGVSIARPQVVDKSYPAFWRDLSLITG